MDQRAGKQPSYLRLMRLALVGFIALTSIALMPTSLAGSEASAAPPAIENPFLDEAGEQAPACGGEGQRACCVGEGLACQAGLVESGDDGVADFFVPVSGDAT